MLDLFVWLLMLPACLLYLGFCFLCWIWCWFGCWVCLLWLWCFSSTFVCFCGLIVGLVCFGFICVAVVLLALVVVVLGLLLG